MAKNVWATGHNDNIYSPSSWSLGAPIAGEQLVMGSGTAYMGGGNLSGDTLTLSGQSAGSSAPLLNLAGGTASVLVHQAQFTMPGGGYVPAAYGTVNVSGGATLNLTVQGGNGTTEVGTANIGGYSTMHGGVTATGTNASAVVNGGGTSLFDNTASSVGTGAVATINANVTGSGSFAMAFQSTLKFTGGVAAGETINNAGGSLTIANASAFHGTVAFLPSTANDLVNLPGVAATSAHYSNGVEHVMNGTADVFDLKINIAAGVPIGFEKSGSGCSLFA